MPVINVYKTHVTRSKYIKQSYYVGGLAISIYKNGQVWVNYNTCKKKNPPKSKPSLNFKNGTKEAKFFKQLLREKQEP